MPDLSELTASLREREARRRCKGDRPMMDMDRTGLLPRDLDTRCPLRRPAVRGREDDRHLLPADLPGAHAEVRERPVLCFGRGRAGSGFRPCLRCRPEISPELAFWRGTSNTVSRALALIESRRTRHGRCRGSRQPAWRWRPAIAPSVPPACRRLADRGGADAARAARQAAHSRDAAVDGRGGAGLGLWQRPALQRNFPRPVRASAGAPAPKQGQRRAARAMRLSVRLAYRPPYDWEAMLAFLDARAIPGVELVSGEQLQAQHCASAEHKRRGDGDAGGQAPRQRLWCDFPTWPRCPRSSRGCAAYSIWPPIPIGSARIWRRIRRWRRWSRRGRACGCPARGTALSSRCARSAGSRSRCLRRPGCSARSCRRMARSLSAVDPGRRGSDPHLPDAEGDRGRRSVIIRDARRAGEGADRAGGGDLRPIP